MTQAFGAVALPLPLAEPYTYRIPESLADRVVPGARVVVPVRERELVGIVTAIGLSEPEHPTRDILSCPDSEAALTPPLLETALWISGYYGAPLGLTLRAMLPAALWGSSRVMARLTGAAVPGGVAGDVGIFLERKGGEVAVGSIARALKRPVWDAINRLVRVGAIALRVEAPPTAGGVATERLVRLTEPVPPLAEREPLFRRSPVQRAALEAIEELGGAAPLRHLLEQLSISRPVIASLVKRGLATVTEIEAPRDPFSDLPDRKRHV